MLPPKTFLYPHKSIYKCMNAFLVKLGTGKHVEYLEKYLYMCWISLMMSAQKLEALNCVEMIYVKN